MLVDAREGEFVAGSERALTLDTVEKLGTHAGTLFGASNYSAKKSSLF
jgi:hypothetical protein